MSFHEFALAVNARYNELAKGELYVTGDNNREIYTVYLAAFPEGTNPVYITNTEHDCNCCKQFLRTIGNVVSIDDNGALKSVWDISDLPYPYNIVAEELDKHVLARPITELFRTEEGSFGNEETRQLVEIKDAPAEIKRWNHFFGVVSPLHHSSTPDADRGKHLESVTMFKRALNELTLDSLDTILELIDGNSLYRGSEHRNAVVEFRKVLLLYTGMPGEYEEMSFLWRNAKLGVARFRNTVIGTLAQDLSEGKDVEYAVKAFETKVAPTNYKRPTALITPGMVKQAMAKIEELGLQDALKRRFAVTEDISINNVLWADNSIAGKMRDGLEDMLLKAAMPSALNEYPAKDIPVSSFIGDIVPLAVSMELFVTNEYMGNFVSLTAPAVKADGKLFKWNNDFAWSYDGNVTDSIKERVKKAGGNVTNAKLRISLSWSNLDDLDIHVVEPSGKEIYFRNKEGKLDVDMNAGWDQTRNPVENVSYSHSLPNGIYRVFIHNFCRRETSDPGFTVEIENQGKIQQLSYPMALRDRDEINVCEIEVANGKVIEIIPQKGIIGGFISQEKWGIATEQFSAVNMMMLSPNFWDGQMVGNSHVFFMLRNCLNDQATRGIYNEFLKDELTPHRKVFEVLGDKTRCQPTGNQLSGLGFSTTVRADVKVRVKGTRTVQVFNVKF